ncbi:hypothetical protein [Pseudarthrobacter sp. NamE2]|uniref:hypothetical protein n=1 Tax=Pseudarthrobacter sp. NamE2 TaxID=2576838 RepID=UPI002104E868|nr:hypothetical protein [Pseudarthrobacter sp. NamE2]
MRIAAILAGQELLEATAHLRASCTTKAEEPCYPPTPGHTTPLPRPAPTEHQLTFHRRPHPDHITLLVLLLGVTSTGRILPCQAPQRQVGLTASFHEHHVWRFQFGGALRRPAA